MTWSKILKPPFGGGGGGLVKTSIFGGLLL